MRDSAFDNSIIIHELTHGLTHRMIGGGTARSLATAEACGLGEGWSDAMAECVKCPAFSTDLKPPSG
jgi:extracellular elastinolytic metalloproteinase